MILRLLPAVLAAGSVVATSPALASGEMDAQAQVDQWIADFNRGDLAAFVARCAPAASVIDGFPPYAWTGCAAWMADYVSNGKKIGLTDGKLAVGEPVSQFSDANRVYLVYPATFTDKEGGEPVTYTGTWAITLEKTTDRWFVTGSGSNWGGNYTVRSEP